MNSTLMQKIGLYLGLSDNKENNIPFTNNTIDTHNQEPINKMQAPTNNIEIDQKLRDLEENSRKHEYNIIALHIKTYKDAKIIGENFCEGNAVILNLSNMRDDEARRVIDFSAGLSFGLNGKIEKITQKVFLLSPCNICVSIEDRNSDKKEE